VAETEPTTAVETVDEEVGEPGADAGAIEAAASPAALEAGPTEEHDEDDNHGHPTTLQYVSIALLLSVVTGIEVGIYYIDMDDWLLVSILLSLAGIKFGTVAAYFMHLKFDNLILRRLFITGIILAAVIYTIVLFTLDILVG
jgi:cytochrome c oxidase subunit IV